MMSANYDRIQEEAMKYVIDTRIPEKRQSAAEQQTAEKRAGKRRPKLSQTMLQRALDCGTVSYYVQQMFLENPGNVELKGEAVGWTDSGTKSGAEVR